MTLQNLLETYNLDHSVLIGYYGGGNYGDELLLEVLANMLTARKVHDVTITYQHPEKYADFHHDFDYTRMLMSDKGRLWRAIRSNKNVLIGGGGLWGLDMNLNVFALSVLLFVSRVFLRKRVFLLGVGYYNSTSLLGRMGAWFAGKAATHIIARDAETLKNFRRITRHVSQDTDMAWYIPELDTSAYHEDLQALDQRLHVRKKALFITLRRFKAANKNAYLQHIETLLENNADRPIIAALLEPQDVDPDNYEHLLAWQQRYPKLQIIDFSYNPLGLLLFFQKHHAKLGLIGPQFHIIITAQLAGVPFLPIAYDNKVTQLLEQLHVAPIPISELSDKQVRHFADNFYEDII